ncbi:asparaginase [Halobacteriales archaeon SW_5_70_135]|nr:MAG: asparaginase [Halobacteriales archaeon SW_5_70_135]
MDVLVHGGAGGGPDDPERRQSVLDDAAERGAAETDPLSAVESAVRVLEADPKFNAGVGSVVQSDGRIRTDAGLMTGDRAAGCACSMAGVEHAVSAARVVLEETPHVLVSGRRATALAEDCGVETDRDLWTEHTRERWAAADGPDGSAREQAEWVREQFGGADAAGADPSRDHDTVGAVARDGDRLAAATSTGGRWFALAGRVGDVPQIGAGVYADAAGAASATGAGEEIARVGVARRAVDLLADGHDAPAAAGLAVDEFEDHTDGNVGVILVGDEVGSATNAAMQTAVTRQ